MWCWRSRLFCMMHIGLLREYFFSWRPYKLVLVRLQEVHGITRRFVLVHVLNLVTRRAHWHEAWVCTVYGSSVMHSSWQPIDIIVSLLVPWIVLWYFYIDYGVYIYYYNQFKLFNQWHWQCVLYDIISASLTWLKRQYKRLSLMRRPTFFFCGIFHE